MSVLLSDGDNYKLIECPECFGSGTRTYERRTRRFFDPFETYDADCERCEGEGKVAVEVHEACGLTESECKCESAEEEKAA